MEGKVEYFKTTKNAFSRIRNKKIKGPYRK